MPTSHGLAHPATKPTEQVFEGAERQDMAATAAKLGFQTRQTHDWRAVVAKKGQWVGVIAAAGATPRKVDTASAPARAPQPPKRQGCWPSHGRSSR